MADTAITTVTIVAMEATVFKAMVMMLIIINKMVILANILVSKQNFNENNNWFWMIFSTFLRIFIFVKHIISLINNIDVIFFVYFFFTFTNQIVAIESGRKDKSQ